MLKHAADLSDNHEYFIVWAGGTNARPWGAKADAFSLFPEFEQSPDGMTLQIAVDTSTETCDVTIGVSESWAKNEWAGATVRLGTNIAAETGYGVVMTNTAIAAGSLGAGTLVIDWTVDPTEEATRPCYLVKGKWGSYPQVRVLTPYQPVDEFDSETDAGQDYPLVGKPSTQGGRSITLPPPYSGSTGATLFNNVGLLLPLSFHEGITGWGVSDNGDSENGTTNSHEITEIDGLVWTYSAPVGVDGHLNGGYLMVDWEHESLMYRSWAPILDSTNRTITLGTLFGDGGVLNLTTGHDAKVKRWTAWVPYFTDSPYAYLPGEGYTYPNHDMMPNAESAIGSNVHNRPRGITGKAYSDTFGALLVAASKISAATGKRINIVNLAVTDATLADSYSRNGNGYNGILGWWRQDDHGTWAPGIATSIYARLSTLLSAVLPNAMLAEGNTKTLRCLGIVFAHGDTDALSVSSRQNYGKAQTRFVKVLRKLIDTLGYNPYANGAEIPFVQPRIPILPYSIDNTYARAPGRGGGTLLYDADTLALVNSAIQENAAADEFSDTVKVDDLPRLSTDPGIYSGVGEAALGSRIGDRMSLLIDHGLSFGSTALDTTQTRIIDICNLALGNIGDAGQITSLDPTVDGSEQALLCRRFLEESRSELLAMRQWSFALRRRQLVAIQRPEPRLYQQWQYCYVVPADALFAFKVVGPVAGEPSEADFDFEQVTSAAYSTTFVEQDGGPSPISSTTPTRPQQIFPPSPTGDSGVILAAVDLLPIVSDIELKPQPYVVEKSPFGHRYLFTNQPGATLQYVSHVVDADQYSSQFASALAANLGSKLASTIIKGDAGEAVSARLLQKTAGYIRMASSTDANEQRPTETNRPFGFLPDHLAHRGGGGASAGGPLSDYPSGFRVL